MLTLKWNFHAAAFYKSEKNQADNDSIRLIASYMTCQQFDQLNVPHNSDFRDYSFSKTKAQPWSYKD